MLFCAPATTPTQPPHTPPPHTNHQAKGNFVLLDPELNVKGTWAKEDTAFGYDFW